MERILCHSIMKHLELYHILMIPPIWFLIRSLLLISIVAESQYGLDNHHQVDLMMLGFCKAFDTLAHNCLLNKLKFYGIQGKLYDWLSIWLIQRTQCVVLDGFVSNHVKVDYDLPQGTVLGTSYNGFALYQ